MDLFDYMRESNKENESPLAMRLRPRTLDEVVGQQHIVGKDKLLYRAIKADKLSSIIFYSEYNKCGFLPDKCYSSRQKGHGRCSRKGEK